MDDGTQRRHAVSGYFDRLASTYGDGALFRKRRGAVIEAIAAELAAARAILDLGCGNGAFAAELVQGSPAPALVGADLAPEMLAAARRRLGRDVALVRADATALPFRPQSFDLVFMSHVLLLVPDLEGCIGQVAACLRPSGTFVATVGAGHWRDALRAVLGADEMGELEMLFGGGMRAADEEERACAACRQAGFLIDTRSASYALTWRDLDEWAHVRWLSIMDDSTRAEAESRLSRIGARVGDARLSFAERIVVARRA